MLYIEDAEKLIVKYHVEVERHDRKIGCKYNEHHKMTMSVTKLQQEQSEAFDKQIWKETKEKIKKEFEYRITETDMERMKRKYIAHTLEELEEELEKLS